MPIDGIDEFKKQLKPLIDMMSEDEDWRNGRVARFWFDEPEIVKKTISAKILSDEDGWRDKLTSRIASQVFG